MWGQRTREASWNLDGAPRGRAAFERTPALKYEKKPRRRTLADSALSRSLQQIAIDISTLRGRLHPLRQAAARAERGDEDRAFAGGHRHARVSHVAAEEQRGACGRSQHGRRSLDAMAERALRPEAGAWGGRGR